MTFGTTVTGDLSVLIAAAYKMYGDNIEQKKMFFVCLFSSQKNIHSLNTVALYFAAQ